MKAVKFWSNDGPLIRTGIYLLSMLALAAIPIAPLAVVPASMAYILTSRKQQMRPVIAVFRRFRSVQVDNFLWRASVVLNHFGRPVWLNSTAHNASELDLFNNPLMGSKLMVVAGAALSNAYLIYLVFTFPYLASIIALPILYLSHMTRRLFYAGIRHSSVSLISLWAIIGASAFVWMFGRETGILWWHYPLDRPLSVLAVKLAVVFAVYLFVTAFLYATPFIRRRNELIKFSRLIASPIHLRGLNEELSQYPLVSPKYLHNAPAGAFQIDVLDSWDMWKPTVKLVLNYATCAIVDLSDAEEGAALWWEVAACKELGVPVLFTCRQDALEPALQVASKMGYRDIQPSTWIPDWDANDYRPFIDRLFEFCRFEARRPPQIIDLEQVYRSVQVELSDSLRARVADTAKMQEHLAQSEARSKRDS